VKREPQRSRGPKIKVINEKRQNGFVPAVIEEKV
jgi:hypothetical protein